MPQKTLRITILISLLLTLSTISLASSQSPTSHHQKTHIAKRHAKQSKHCKVLKSQSIDACEHDQSNTSKTSTGRSSAIQDPYEEGWYYSRHPAQEENKPNCDNSKRGNKKDKKSKDGKYHFCDCWGNANPGDPKNPNCKPPEGEDHRCTNHCRKDKCSCKTKCQS